LCLQTVYENLPEVPDTDIYPDVCSELQSLCHSAYDTIEEFNVDSKAEYSALSSTRCQKKKKLKQTNACNL